MPIRHPRAPDEGRGIAHERIRGIFGIPTFAARITGREDVDEVHTTDPHGVYVVALRDVADGVLLEAAHQVAWRYLVVDGDRVVSEVHVSHDKKRPHENLRFAGLGHGPLVQATQEALHVAHGLEHVEREDAELRFLDLPGLHFHALWLHGDARDVLIPIRGHPAGIEALRAYTPEEILERLRPVAVEALTAEGPGPTPPGGAAAD